jgi:hypothetical protein
MIFNGYDKVAHISNWTDCKDYISSEFVANQPGDYEVSIKYSSDSTAAGSKARIMVNSETIYFISENTGGWKGENYQTKKCGVISLANGGTQIITITPNCEKWKNIAIKEIILKQKK